MITEIFILEKRGDKMKISYYQFDFISFFKVFKKMKHSDIMILLDNQ